VVLHETCIVVALRGEHLGRDGLSWTIAPPVEASVSGDDGAVVRPLTLAVELTVDDVCSML
jgi:hypothetical protein